MLGDDKKKHQFAFYNIIKITSHVLEKHLIKCIVLDLSSSNFKYNMGRHVALVAVRF